MVLVLVNAFLPVKYSMYFLFVNGGFRAFLAKSLIICYTTDGYDLCHTLHENRKIQDEVFSL